jgi:ACS family allantoate permease-like MFS transporter
MLVGLPCGALEIIVTWVAALGMRYTKNMRSFWGILLTLVPLIGSALMMTIPKSEKWGIVVATWLAACSTSLMVITTSLIATNVKGNTKKSAVSAIFFIGYSIGCISGPQLWQAKDAPRYTKGCISSLVSWALLVVTFAVYYLYLRRENTKRAAIVLAVTEEIVADGKTTDNNTGVELDSDLTDWQDLKFMYTL